MACKPPRQQVLKPSPDAPHLPAERDEIIGKIIKHEAFPVKGLPSRDILVWLPPSYDSAANRKYPVLYMHDGQNVFDPKTSWVTHKDWRLDETCDYLIRNHRMEEVIIVAVYSNKNRLVELAPGKEGTLYKKFFVEDLKPFIDKTYRTQTDPAHTAVMGSSMGGLMAFMLAWEYPDVYGMAGCLSPAFRYLKHDYTKTVAADKGPHRNIKIWIDNGTTDLEPVLQPGIDDMMSVLRSQNYSFEWYLDQGASHTETAWAARAWRPLLYFFASKSSSDK
jgi:predicted alpha/beta superfamily hydrolase